MIKSTITSCILFFVSTTYVLDMKAEDIDKATKAFSKIAVTLLDGSDEPEIIRSEADIVKNILDNPRTDVVSSEVGSHDFTEEKYVLRKNTNSKNLKVQEVVINARFEPENSFTSIEGVIKFERKISDSIQFHLHGELNIDSIKVNEKHVKFESQKIFSYKDYSLIINQTVIEPTYSKEVHIYYSGKINPSTVRSPSDYMRISAKDGVLLRNYFYSPWIPIFLKDEEPDYSINIKAKFDLPKEYSPIFVGSSVTEEIQNDRLSSTWEAKNVGFFNLQFTARQYKRIHENGLNIYYLPKESSYNQSKKIADLSSRILNFYKIHYKNSGINSEEFHIAEMPEFGDISSFNMIGISNQYWDSFKADVPNRSAIVIAHELVHPFVQINISKGNSLYALVIEGFPNYFHLLALESIYGQNWYSNFIEQIRNNYEKRISNPTSYPENKPILKITADEISIYKDRFILNDRVLLFLDTLRNKIGKENFLFFCKELFNLEKIDFGIFKKITFKYDNGKTDLDYWLTK